MNLNQKEGGGGCDLVTSVFNMSIIQFVPLILSDYCLFPLKGFYLVPFMEFIQFRRYTHSRMKEDPAYVLQKRYVLLLFKHKMHAIVQQCSAPLKKKNKSVPLPLITIFPIFYSEI